MAACYRSSRGQDRNLHLHFGQWPLLNSQNNLRPKFEYFMKHLRSNSFFDLHVCRKVERDCSAFFVFTKNVPILLISSCIVPPRFNRININWIESKWLHRKSGSRSIAMMFRPPPSVQVPINLTAVILVKVLAQLTKCIPRKLRYFVLDVISCLKI